MNKVNFPNFQSNKWQLDRRFMLKGMGAALALPFLNAMQPLNAAENKSKAKVARSVFVYFPNGVNGMDWQIKESGKNYQFSPSLKPLENHRDNLTVFSGLHHPNGIGQAHVCGDSWLTGAKINAQSGQSYKNSVSCDQIISEEVGKYTRFPSLELSISSGTGKPFGSHTLAFSKQGVPLPAISRHQEIFKRLFHSDSASIKQKKVNLAKEKSVLDSLLSHAKSLKSRIGAEDKTKLDEYLHAVRDVEKRTIRLEQWLDVPYPKIDTKTKSKLSRKIDRSKTGDYWRTMFDLIALAIQTDMTRAVTYMSGTEGNGLSIPEIKIAASRHNLSHHNGDPVVLKRLASWDKFFMTQFSYFLDKLQNTKEGDGNLLGNTMVMCGSGMSYGHSHCNSNLPIVFAGGGDLGIKHGQHIDYNRPFLKDDYSLSYDEWKKLCGKPKDNKARLSNLQLTMIQKMNIERESFADSIAPISEII